MVRFTFHPLLKFYRLYVPLSIYTPVGEQSFSYLSPRPQTNNPHISTHRVRLIKYQAGNSPSRAEHILFSISLTARIPAMASLNLSTNGPSISKSYQSVVNAPPPSGAAAASSTYGQWAIFSVTAPLANAFQDSGNKESVLKVQSTGGV